jgi:hypothetical protein
MRETNVMPGGVDANVQPSRMTLRPSNVVAKIAPVDVYS